MHDRLMLYSFGYSQLVHTSSRPVKMQLKMQRTESQVVNTTSSHVKECSTNR